MRFLSPKLTEIWDTSARGVIRSTLGGIYTDMAMDTTKYPDAAALWKGLNSCIDSKSAFNSTYLISRILTDTVGETKTQCDTEDLQAYYQAKQDNYRRLNT